MDTKKRVALVAHDNMKRDLAEWVDWNWEKLLQHHLICTGTTGKMVARTLMDRRGNEHGRFDITLLKSGPLGGDQQLGAMIAEGGVEALIFFWDPMQAQPHDVDVKALLRLATLYNVPTAINRSSADFLISSPLFGGDYVPVVKDYKSASLFFVPLRICVFQTGSSRGKVFLGAVWPCIVARFEVLLCTVRCGVLPYAVLCCAGFSGLFSGHAIGCRGYVGRL